jgi:carbamoyl-phosphate synthase large subunit
VDTILGPEMRSTGEVMGVGKSFSEAFVKSQLAAGVILPTAGKVFLSVRDEDKNKIIDIAQKLSETGFELIATSGTAGALVDKGLEVSRVNKVAEGRPHVVDMIKNGEIAMIINTVGDSQTSIRDSYSIRRSALQGRVTYFTTTAGAKAASQGISQMTDMQVYSVQSSHSSID